MRNILIYVIAAFVISLIAAPFIIKGLRRLKAGQAILHYVDFHASKSGTPTMGGFIFILPMILLSPIFLRSNTPFALVIVVSSLGFALLGFLDDFIKVKTKKNLGLRAYQKIIGQGGIALLVAIFYFLVNQEGRILIPFVNIYFDIGWFIIPLVFIAIIATTNSVNLTDGIDGLAGSVTIAYLVFFIVISYFVSVGGSLLELGQMHWISAITIGGLMTFLMFNTNKAKVFMGDTGSLYLGSLVATLAIFSFMSFFIIILGIMYVVSSLSVIIQVAYFKKTKGKRVFLMTPFHHHLEKKGFAEARIVAVYLIITVVIGLGIVASFL
ncbi:MAG: phospho-N-acetylmuramoyl-pentapeptide-transferase [Firmicutes bacterium]|nr:phospho-N-acetylmuramoyl-pentapeptide-transferase [Bacillota bacterium]